MSAALNHFYKRLAETGYTDEERAAHFGVSRRTIFYWKEGRKLPTVRVLLNDPASLRALADDAEAGLRAMHGDTKESAA